MSDRSAGFVFSTSSGALPEESEVLLLLLALLLSLVLDLLLRLLPGLVGSRPASRQEPREHQQGHNPYRRPNLRYFSNRPLLRLFGPLSPSCFTARRSPPRLLRVRPLGGVPRRHRSAPPSATHHRRLGASHVLILADEDELAMITRRRRCRGLLFGGVCGRGFLRSRPARRFVVYSSPKAKVRTGQGYAFREPFLSGRSLPSLFVHQPRKTRVLRTAPLRRPKSSTR